MASTFSTPTWESLQSWEAWRGLFILNCPPLDRLPSRTWKIFFWKPPKTGLLEIRKADVDLRHGPARTASLRNLKSAWDGEFGPCAWGANVACPNPLKSPRRRSAQRFDVKNASSVEVEPHNTLTRAHACLSSVKQRQPNAMLAHMAGLASWTASMLNERLWGSSAAPRVSLIHADDEQIGRWPQHISKQRPRGQNGRMSAPSADDGPATPNNVLTKCKKPETQKNNDCDHIDH